MADKLIKELTTLGTGSIENEDWLEIQEDDSSTSKKVTVEVLNEIEAAARAAQDDVIEASVGLTAAGGYNTPSGTNYLDSTTDVMDALETLDDAIGDGVLTNVNVEISSGDLYTCGVTPVEIVAAPGTNKYIEVVSCSAYLWDVGVTMEVDTQKLVLQYDTGASPIMEWSNSFIESASTVMNRGTWTSNVVMVNNEGIEITFSGGANATAGSQQLIVCISYIIRDLSGVLAP